MRGRVERAGRVVPGLLRELESANVTLESIEVHRPTLDDVFLNLTGRSLRDAEAEEADTPGDDAEAELPLRDVRFAHSSGTEGAAR